MKKIIFSAGLLAALWGCSNILDDAQYAADIKLGAKDKTAECPKDYGECSFEVVANCEWTASIIKGAEWLSFSGNDAVSEQVFDGDATLELSFTSNRGYRRSARVVLSAGARYDTLTVKQNGSFEQEVVSDTETLAVLGEGGSYDVGITTNLLKKDFHFETVDSKGYPLSGKADKYKYADGRFSFRILPSESRDEKTFIVRIYALDDWGEKVTADITVTQKAGRE